LKQWGGRPSTEAQAYIKYVEHRNGSMTPQCTI
jgi:hypothetical protein